MEHEVIEGEVVAEEPPVDEEKLGQMEQAAIAVREHVTVTPATMPSPREWDAMRAMAETIALTEFVPRDFRGRPEAVLAAILSGRELGIGPMQSLKDISIIDGRPALAAHLVLAMLRKGGVVIDQAESTDERAYIRAHRQDTGEQAEIEWTMEEAQRAGLANKDNFRKYPRDMLWARAVGRLGRRLGSDLLAGMPYTAEEVQDFEDFDEAPGGGYVRGPINPRRQEGVGPVATPQTWSEIEATIRAYGEDMWEAFLVFAADTTQLLYKTRDPATLTQQQRSVIRQKASGAMVNFAEAKDPDGMPPPVREDMARAWASVLDGVTLPGPAWRMGPSELDRPTYTEVAAAKAAEAASGAETEPEDQPEAPAE